MLNKPFDLINKDDIEDLVLHSVREDKTLEYKETLPGNSDDEKREFLADISSFANAAGGILIYGIREQRDENGKTTGIPEEITGLGGINADMEIRRLDSLLQTGIAQRIFGVQIKTIDGFLVGEVLIIQVPASWNSPHMVTFKNLSRFFARGNGSRQQLDVNDLRAAFIASESLKEKIQQFRSDRIAKLITGESPVKLASGPKLMLHLIPIATFNSPTQIDIRAISTTSLPAPLEASGWNYRFNLDGFVKYAPAGYSYTQTFRNGSIEAIVSLARAGNQKILSSGYEKTVLRGLQNYVGFLQKLVIAPPIIIFLTFTGVKGYMLGSSSPRLFPHEEHGIDRDVLIIPETSLEDYSVNLKDEMRMSFDAIWQASGHAGSPSYNEVGEW